jgi:ketosteroid isomerase-like protein
MTTDSVHQDLLKLYEEWFTALGQDDPSFFERTLSDDWHYTDVRGRNRGKQEYLEYIAPLRSDVPVNRIVEMVVRPFGELVLVHGDYVVGEAFAPPEGSTTRFTAVWQRQDGTWRALAHHATVLRDQA